MNKNITNSSRISLYGEYLRKKNKKEAEELELEIINSELDRTEKEFFLQIGKIYGRKLEKKIEFNENRKKIDKNRFENYIKNSLIFKSSKFDKIILGMILLLGFISYFIFPYYTNCITEYTNYIIVAAVLSIIPSLIIFIFFNNMKNMILKLKIIDELIFICCIMIIIPWLKIGDFRLIIITILCCIIYSILFGIFKWSKISDRVLFSLKTYPVFVVVFGTAFIPGINSLKNYEEKLKIIKFEIQEVNTDYKGTKNYYCNTTIDGRTLITFKINRKNMIKKGTEIKINRGYLGLIKQIKY